jgi:hypothetical protein
MQTSALTVTRRRTLRGKGTTQRSNRNRLVFHHAEQGLRPRAGKWLGDRPQDAQAIERRLPVSEALRPVGAKAVVAEEPAAWLVLQENHSSRSQHP